MSMWADNPQAKQIDALIERAGRLTPDEIGKLAEDADQDAVRAWFAARQVARRVAQDAARHADWFAVRFAVRFAARFAGRGAVRAAVRARFAARFAARDATRVAVALVVRDLIDEDTEWNQAAYDLLTGPWRRVIGPVHPDDEVLR